MEDEDRDVQKNIFNLGFDFYSGQPNLIYTKDGYENSLFMKTIPAYRFYPEMGLGINTGKNMLIQNAATYTYLNKDYFSPINNRLFDIFSGWQ